MKSLKLVLFVQFAVIVDLIQTVYTIGLAQNGNAVIGGSFKLDCVTDSLTAIVQIADPSGVIAANCIIPTGSATTCLPGTDPNYSSSQVVDNKTTSVTITTTNRASHGGTWTCTKLGDASFTAIVIVLTVPASITEQTTPVTDFEVTTSTSKTMTAVVECAYPSAQIDWEFVTETSASTGISPTRNTCTDMGLTGGACSDAAAKTFHCDFTVTETSTASLSAGKYKLKANLYMDGEVTSTGISVELTPIITITATTTTPASSSSSSCDSCTPTFVLAAIGLAVAVIFVVVYPILYSCELSGKLQDLDLALIKSKSDRGKFECSVTWCFRATIIAIVVLVIGLCIGGVIICVTCDDSVSSSNSVTVGFALAVVGLVLAVVVIILVILFCCGVITIKDDDDDYIKNLKTSYAITEGTTFTIPCSASSAASAATATSFSWERTIDGRTSPIRIDGAHFSEVTTGSPSLTIINASITDSGTYTCVASNSAGTARASTQLTVSKRNPEHTETNQVNPKNVTDDEKFVKKGETTDDQKATVVEMKGIDKNDKVDNV